MRRLSRSRSTLCSLVAVAVFSLAGNSASAQAARQASDASAARAPTPAPVLVTDESARVGVARAKTVVNANAATAAQPSDNTVKWAIIIGVAVLAALLIVALAD